MASASASISTSASTPMRRKRRPKATAATLPSAAQAAGCWMDVFEKPWFAGKVYRLHGPGQYHAARLGDIRPASAIVGPGALVMGLTGKRRLTLRPGQIVPDLTKRSFAKKLQEFQIIVARETD